ncbi:unnamed protein product [Rotaria sordida]|uniref:Uncharacterized protein n=1 Tax=Rotaria sordida TaxID=392033 RepID=A0A815T0H0_9BILA|nr:unnamed protein product [Rotaria sordida]
MTAIYQVISRIYLILNAIHFNGPLNKIARYWIYDKAFHHNLFGYESISETTISFHYTQPEDMYQMDSLLYHIRQLDKEVCLSHS